MQRLYIAFALFALVGANGLFAQDNTAQGRAIAAQLRAQAKQLEGQLSKQDIADMLAQADEMEKAADEGAFNAGPAKVENDVYARLTREHGRVEWLSKYATCTGFQDHDPDSFAMTVGTRLAERNPVCRSIYRHYRRSVELGRGGSSREAEAALEAYDAEARAAVERFGKD